MEEVEQLDVSQYSTAEDASKAFADKIREIAEMEFDQDPELEVTREYKEAQNVWVVYWDGGPFEWSPRLMGGTPIISAQPEVVGFQDNTEVRVECKNELSVVFADS